jgi:hypothetical protein
VSSRSFAAFSAAALSTDIRGNPDYGIERRLVGALLAPPRSASPVPCDRWLNASPYFLFVDAVLTARMMAPRVLLPFVAVRDFGSSIVAKLDCGEVGCWCN